MAAEATNSGEVSMSLEHALAVAYRTRTLGRTEATSGGLGNIWALRLPAVPTDLGLACER